jgi:hypothetical protein
VSRVLAGAVVAALCCAGAATAAKRPLPGLRSPSGNITCLAVPVPPASLVCSLRRSDYAQALQERCMAGPSVDWHGFELPARRRATILCSGGILYSPDTEQPVYRTVAYGRSWRAGPFTCWSRVAGVTCRNRAGHGLFVSRQRWRVW